jgi:Trk K+ transport system NAD-binding subunit
MKRDMLLFVLGAALSFAIFFFVFFLFPILMNAQPFLDFNTAVTLTAAGIAVSSIAVKRTEIKVEKVKEETYTINPKEVAKEVFNILKSEKEGQALMLFDAYQSSVIELRCAQDNEIVDMLKDGSLICRAGHRVWPPGPTKIIIKPEESEELKKSGKVTVKKKEVEKNDEKSDSNPSAP